MVLQDIWGQDFAGLFDTIQAEDVQEMFRRWAQPNRSTMSVVEPK